MLSAEAFALAAGFIPGSSALVGFDSAIEVTSSLAALWRLRWDADDTPLCRAGSPAASGAAHSKRKRGNPCLRLPLSNPSRGTRPGRGARLVVG